MFVGHFGVAFAAKRVAPSAGLGTLFLSAQFVDLIWPTLLLVGWERVAITPGITVVTPLDFVHYPISHSAAAVAVWGVLIGLAYYAVTDRKRDGLLVALLVMSHWVLDAIVHRPDLPLTPFTPERIGLGLWDSLPATLAVELPIFVGGCWLYARFTQPRDAVGRWALWGLVAFLAVIQVVNLAGPPPPSVAAIAWAGHAQWLLVLWAYWVDRHREVIA
jgi:hypothetical protein